MTQLRPVTANDQWLNQIFAAKSVQTGGVVRRQVEDVDRKIGRAALELEVRRRGFHLVEAGGQYIVICTRAPLRVLV
ncbi:N-(5'-phosphoribosyl)anthranilate isomerase [Vannielia litorea]|uniref:N-(5'-phosphoribosyl)anthranilate isomerase n=1 Tax=Vannielia litorea TaxID=1217970 RepID=A0A1N6FES4_9RHOB|nr:N-(5'-phosphoribosyl)anthranilate isomerase [Vannielia litorea]SIN93704.1 hypothetical protein SAMN05444002_1612 [Vannielia litorea]